MKIHIWRVLLQEACGSIDELVERGLQPNAADIVDCVLAAHKFVRGIEHYRRPLGEEVENYLCVTATPADGDELALLEE